MCYAKKFYHVILEDNAQDLLSIESQEKRLNVMKSLTALSKYLGIYDRWQEMRRRFNLKWSSGNESMQSFERFFNDELSFDVMLQRIKEMIKKLPVQMGNIIKFDCLTGLRPAEAVESVRLINDKKEAFAKYYKPERQALEHFRFPDVFLRQTKKAYISFVKPEMLEIVSAMDKIPSYNAIRLAARKKGLKCDMRYCRKIFASYLHHSGGIASEEIDFLQGRVSTSVFSRHYLTRQQDLKDRVIDSVQKLSKQIES